MNILYWLPVVYSIGLVIIFNIQPRSTMMAFLQGLFVIAWTIGTLLVMRWNRWKGIPVLRPLIPIVHTAIAWWFLYLSSDTTNARFWAMACSALYGVVVLGWYAAIVLIPARSGRLNHYQHWMVASGIGSIVLWAIVLWTINEPFFFYSFSQVLVLTSLIAWGVIQSTLWAITSSPARALVARSVMGALLITELLWMPISIGVRLLILFSLIGIVVGGRTKQE